MDASLRPIVSSPTVHQYSAQGDKTAVSVPCLGQWVHTQGFVCAFAIDLASQINVTWLVWLSKLSPCTRSLILTLDPKRESSPRNLADFDHRAVQRGCGVNVLCEEESMMRSSFCKGWLLCNKNAQRLSSRMWIFTFLSQTSVKSPAVVNC